MEFAIKKPVSRILVNTPSSQGAIGHTTGLAPSLTLGSGTMGGSITSDNVTPMHLINIRRLAYDLSGKSVKTPKTGKLSFAKSDIIKAVEELMNKGAGQQNQY